MANVKEEPLFTKDELKKLKADSKTPVTHAQLQAIVRAATKAITSIEVAGYTSLDTYEAIGELRQAIDDCLATAAMSLLEMRGSRGPKRRPKCKHDEICCANCGFIVKVHAETNLVVV